MSEIRDFSVNVIWTARKKGLAGCGVRMRQTCCDIAVLRHTL